MYIKFEEDDSYGFYSPEIHGEEITTDESYIPITEELYNLAMKNSGVKILNRDLELVDIVLEPAPPREPTEIELLMEAVFGIEVGR